MNLFVLHSLTITHAWLNGFFPIILHSRKPLCTLNLDCLTWNTSSSSNLVVHNWVTLSLSRIYVITLSCLYCIKGRIIELSLGKKKLYTVFIFACPVHAYGQFLRSYWQPVLVAINKRYIGKKRIKLENFNLSWKYKKNPACR